MAADGKALLDLGKALIRLPSQSDNKAMLSTAETIKRKMAEVLESGVRQSDIAAHCGVSKQAVQSWKNTGRIDKKHLPGLAEVSKRSLEWWLEPVPEPRPAILAISGERIPRAGEKQGEYNANATAVWPFKRIDVRDYMLLNDHQRSLVEAYTQALLDEVKRNKRDGASHAA